MILKIIAALGLGFAAMAGLQTAGVWSLQKYLKSDRAKAGVPEIGKMDFSAKFKGTLTAEQLMPKYGPIDTTAGQRAAINSMGHQMYLQHRAAQNAVPLPPRIPGVRR